MGRSKKYCDLRTKIDELLSYEFKGLTISKLLCSSENRIYPTVRAGGQLFLILHQS